MTTLKDGARKTLGAGELDRDPGECYHLACYEQAYHQTRHRKDRAQGAPSEPLQHDRGAPSDAPIPLGSGDGPIKIVEYDRSWPAAYLAERGRLAPLLPGVPIFHIGSTAVPGLAAKPVIDMIALVDDLDANVAKLVRLAGYHLPAEFNANLDHRRFLCYPTLSHRTHHLHLVDEHAGVDQCLRFRERLQEDPALAAQYAALKRSLANRFQEDRIGYTEAKSAFIKDAIQQPHTNPGTDPDRR